MPRTSQAALLFDHALKFVQPLRTADGHAWAVIPTGPFAHRGDLIASSEFRDWLAAHFHHEHEIFPSPSALNHAVRMLAAHAIHTEVPAIETFTRIGRRGDSHRPDAILLDLANPTHDVLEITAEGRRILPNDNCRFLSAADAHSLPHPVDSSLSPLEHLRDILHLPDPALHAAQDWLLAALRPSGPYPTLVITGPSGSGKTTLARTLRNIIDPAAALSPIPRTVRQLHAHALRHYVLVFDHINSLPKEISASVSRLTAGTAIATPARSIVDDPKPIPIARPVIITAPDLHGSFPANSIHIRLDAIAPENLRDEASIQQQAAESAPALLGALCSALSAKLAQAKPAQAACSATAAVSHSAPISPITDRLENGEIGVSPSPRAPASVIVSASLVAQEGFS